MAETEIAMLARLRGEVLDGSRFSAWRPGHRPYEEGPAVVKFLDTGPHGNFWTDDKPVDVIITSVVHTQATGKYAIFADFLGLGEDITLLEWTRV